MWWRNHAWVTGPLMIVGGVGLVLDGVYDGVLGADTVAWWQFPVGAFYVFVGCLIVAWLWDSRDE